MNNKEEILHKKGRQSELSHSRIFWFHLLQPSEVCEVVGEIKIFIFVFVLIVIKERFTRPLFDLIYSATITVPQVLYFELMPGAVHLNCHFE